MLTVLRTTWPLYLGLLLLMIGNGMQGTLLGIRGALEGFDTFQMSLVMAAYFAGFLGGSRLTPRLLRAVGHVRVFAALGSLISAILVLYPLLPDWPVWALLRMAIGFCFAGVYVTAESWINDASANETRGRALSVYMMVIMLGILLAQVLVNLGDPAGFALFILPAVLVSLSFMPILLTAGPAPSYVDTRKMSFDRLLRVSPLGCAGMLLTGGMFAALFGMGAVWGTVAGLSVVQITLFVSASYIGGMALQYPIGRLSDRTDRRLLVAILSLGGAVAMLAGGVLALPFGALLALSFILGGVINPLYSLLIAHANDFLEPQDMSAASSGLIFLHGLGAVTGPVVTGWMMGLFGPGGFFLYLSILLALMGLYTLWRMTRRPAPPSSATGAFVAVNPVAPTLGVEAIVEGRTPDLRTPDLRPEGAPEGGGTGILEQREK